MIRTRIIATLGPASGAPGRIRELVAAGADVFRLNFSHGTLEQKDVWLREIRAVEAERGEPLAVLADLCGPKIRVGEIAGGSVQLVEGQTLILQREAAVGNAERISLTLPELVEAARVGDAVLLDDGKVRLEVTEAGRPDRIVCRVAVGGALSSGKGANLPHTALKLSALTEKDQADIEWLARRDVDYVALSFVRRAADVAALRDRLTARDCGARIVAKIEKPQALERIDEIIAAADAVMVARGDLGVEMDLPAVPVAQKRIARLCQAAGKPCIVATQMLESMTQAPAPTRAEVSDVANAVLDHADAVMLSGETAVGAHPVEAVGMMNRIVGAIQAYHDETVHAARDGTASAGLSAALAVAVRELIAREPVAAVAVFTLTGATALMFSKQRLSVPILALSPDPRALRRTCLYYGVQGSRVPLVEHTRDILSQASRFALARGVARPGEKLIVISGRPIGEAGRTNTLVVHTVPAEPAS